MFHKLRDGVRAFLAMRAAWYHHAFAALGDARRIFNERREIVLPKFRLPLRKTLSDLRREQLSSHLDVKRSIKNNETFGFVDDVSIRIRFAECSQEFVDRHLL